LLGQECRSAEPTCTPSPRPQLQKLLDTEAALCLEAKAALEEALAASQRADAMATAERGRLRRELDGRTEALRRTELALRVSGGGGASWGGAGSGRCAPGGGGGPHASRAGSLAGGGGGGAVVGSLEELRGVGPGENVIEFHLGEAVIEVGGRADLGCDGCRGTLQPVLAAAVRPPKSLPASWHAPTRRPHQPPPPSPQDAGLASGPPLFAAWDFFLHDSQASGLAPPPAPAWGATVAYIVEDGPLLAEYLAAKTMAVRGVRGG
jgi:hypothetical protein